MLKKYNFYNNKKVQIFSIYNIFYILICVLINYMLLYYFVLYVFFRYSASQASLTAKTLSDDIKTDIKQLDVPRYKLVCLVTIGEKKKQELRLSSQCMWDVKVDSSVTYTWEADERHFFCCVVLYAIYRE